MFLNCWNVLNHTPSGSQTGRAETVKAKSKHQTSHLNDTGPGILLLGEITEDGFDCKRVLFVFGGNDTEDFQWEYIHSCFIKYCSAGGNRHGSVHSFQESKIRYQRSIIMYHGSRLKNQGDLFIVIQQLCLRN